MNSRAFLIKFSGSPEELALIGERELTEDLCAVECPLPFAAVEVIEVSPDRLQPTMPGTASDKQGRKPATTEGAPP